MKRTFSILLFFLFSATLCFGAQNKKSDKKNTIFYTYLGPFTEGGYNIVSVNSWNPGTSTYIPDQKSYGALVNGGLELAIFTKHLAGDLKISFNYNFLDTGNIYNLKASLTGKVIFQIKDFFYLTVGPGVYFEFQPSNLDYLGSAGVQLPLGMIIQTTETTRLIIDLVSRFGYYGIGAASYKLSFGISIGFLFRVGKL